MLLKACDKGEFKLDSIKQCIAGGDVMSRSLYEKVKVRSLMHSASDIIYYEKDSVEEILNKFKGSGAWNLPVIKNGKYFGFISKSRLLTAYRRKLIDVTA